MILPQEMKSNAKMSIYIGQFVNIWSVTILRLDCNERKEQQEYIKCLRSYLKYKFTVWRQ